MRTLFAAALALLTCAALSCGGDDGLTGPTEGALEVTLSMTGEELDPDGCQVSVDGGSPLAITEGSSVSFTSLEAGSHSVLLDDVAVNCAIEGLNPRTVSVVAGTTTPITFSVACSATTGSLEVLLTMTGEYLDTDGGQVSVDGGVASQLERDSAVTFTDLAPGLHTVLLDDVAVNCAIEGQNPRDVEVVAGQTAPTTYAVECGPCGAGHGPYQAVDLGTLGGDDSYAYGINNHGQVVGVSETTQGGSGWHAFLWEDGVMIDLGTLGGHGSEAFSINDNGQVVGVSDRERDPEEPRSYSHAFLWEDGVMTDLGAPGGTSSQAWDINNHGQVVGYGGVADDLDVRHAFLWEDGVMTDLGTLGGYSSTAYAINDHGQIVGYFWTGSIGERERHAFLWEDGVVTDLDTSGTWSRARDINDHGQIVGINVRAEDVWSGVIWDDGAMIEIGAFEPVAINNCGQVVGYRFGGSWNTGGPYDLLLWEDGVLTDLGPIVERLALGINDAGQVVGTVGYAEYSYAHATLWTRSYDSP